MPVYRYKKTIFVADDEDVILEVTFPDPGTSAEHIIKHPNSGEIERENEFTENLGKGKELKGKKVEVLSKAANIDKPNPDIKIDYEIKNHEIVNHSNPKANDITPTIIVTYDFINKE
jgi:hypothetical protein